MLEALTRRGFLHRLDSLARAGTAAPAEAILDLLVDLFSLQDESVLPETRELCLDLIARVMPRVAAEAAAEPLRRLAAMPALPARRLMEWAAGPIATAAPFLEHGRNLSNGDLVRILLNATPAHLRAAARRSELSERVTDLIVLRGDREAMRRLAGNKSARLSRASFNALAGFAATDAALKSALILRSDLPASVVEKLWPGLRLEQQAQLIASGWRYSPAEMEEIGRETAAELMNAVRNGRIPKSVDSYRTLVADGELSLSAALAEILDGGRLVEAAQLAGRVLGISEGIAVNLLYGSYDRGAAILACHGELEDEVVLQLACARSRLPWVRSTDIRHALTLAREMLKSEALDLLIALEGLWVVRASEDDDGRRRFRSRGERRTGGPSGIRAG